MFIKNITAKDVPLNSFEGYKFLVPPGVSAIWSPAGEQLLKIHKIESKGGVERHMTSTGVVELDNGHGVPALYEATEAEWKKQGRKLAHVERFIVNHKLIPRAKLITTALARGISHNRVLEYQMDNSIDIEIIAKEINELPVPEEIKYPHPIEDNDPVNEKKEEVFS